MFSQKSLDHCKVFCARLKTDFTPQNNGTNGSLN